MRNANTADARPGRRNGYAAVMAMLLLVLGSVTAAGLYSLVQTSTKVSANERSVTKSQDALDSGIQFYKYQIAQAVKPVATSLNIGNVNTWVNTLKTNLATTIEGHNGIAVGAVGWSATVLDIHGNITTPPVITLPEITFGTETKFSAVITTDTSANLRMIVTGKYVTDTAQNTGITRSATIGFTVTPKSPGAPMLFPLAARGGIPKAWNVTPDGSTKVKDYGTATSVPLTDGGTGTILVYPPPAPQWDGQAVAFPDEDAAIASVAALNLPALSASAGATINGTSSSVSIPANKNYTLTGTINGIVYVAWPNNITISGTTTINGTIVFQRAPKGSTAGSTTLTFVRTGTISRPMDASDTKILTPSVTPAFTGNDQMKWWAIIAPDTVLSLPNGTTGGAIKNFEGSFLIYSFSRTGGGDKAGFEITRGGIAAEDQISIGSNGASYTVDADTTNVSGANGTDGTLSLTWDSYDEGGI